MRILAAVLAAGMFVPLIAALLLAIARQNRLAHLALAAAWLLGAVACAVDRLDVGVIVFVAVAFVQLCLACRPLHTWSGWGGS